MALLAHSLKQRSENPKQNKCEHLLQFNIWRLCLKFNYLIMDEYWLIQEYCFNNYNLKIFVYSSV